MNGACEHRVSTYNARDHETTGLEERRGEFGNFHTLQQSVLFPLAAEQPSLARFVEIHLAVVCTAARVGFWRACALA